jgi:hypothetical protein
VTGGVFDTGGAAEEAAGDGDGRRGWRRSQRKKAEAAVTVARPVPPPALRAPARLAIITRRRSPSTEPHATRSHAGTSERAHDWAAEAASMAGRDLHARSGARGSIRGGGARSGGVAQFAMPLDMGNYYPYPNP